MADQKTETEIPKEEKEELETKPEAGEGEEEKPKEEEEKKPEKPAEPPKEEEEPPVRKSAKDFIIKRKDRKIKKLEAKKEEEADADDDVLAPEGKTAIRQEVEAQTAPILQGMRTQADERELQDVFAKFPDAKDQEKTIRKYMESDAYKNVSVEFIYLGLAAKKMELNKKRAEADAEAADKGLGGSGRRPRKLTKIPDVRNMTDEQVEELAHKVKTGQL